MKLFKINKDDVIRTQNGLWQWNEDEEEFDDIGNTYEDESSLKSVNAIYQHGNSKNQFSIDAGDLIGVSNSEDSGELFTIVETSIVEVKELFDTAHKAGLNLSEYLTGLASDRFYEPYKVYDLTAKAK